MIPFHTLNWETIPTTEHKGTTGVAYWRTQVYGGLRIRMVEYSAGYLADHWCEKGHIIYCIEGEMTTELKDGSEHLLAAGMTYQVSDGLSSHRSKTTNGAKLFILDGDFLR
jgi:quercetin dioxygenase-like cupin family protein